MKKKPTKSLPPQLANLLIDMRKGLFALEFLPELVISPETVFEHLVELVSGQLGLRIQGHVTLMVDGEALQATLAVDFVVRF